MFLYIKIIITLKPVASHHLQYEKIVKNITIPPNNPSWKIRTMKVINNRQYAFNESLHGSEVLQLEYWHKNKQKQSWHN